MSHPKLGRLGRLAVVLAAASTLGACLDRDPVGPSVRGEGPMLRQLATQSWNGQVRIGVVPAASTVQIGSAGGWTITAKGSGAVLMTGTGGTVAVTAAATTTTWWRLQVVCGSAASVAARQAAAEADGHVTFTEPVPAAGCTRLLIGNFPLSATFTERNNYRNLLIAQGHSGGDSFWVQRTEGATQYTLTRGGVTVTATSEPVLTADDGLVTIGSRRYRGVAEVRVNSAGTLAGINELPMEEYLYGVVPRELGPVAFPELEALKAQAVAARTYALRGLGKRAADGYDLLATTADQVYGGYQDEHPLSTRAVDETAGIAITHDGRLIEALYSSTSGGHTADNEEVYNSAPVAYLRGVPDAQRGQAFNHVPSIEVFRNHANPTSLRAAKAGDFDSDWGRFHRWSFEWSMEEISAVISTFAGQPVGTVHAINVLERGPSGRVLRIEYVTDAGTFQDTKDRIRSSLRYINASGAPTNLLSTLFFVEPVIDRPSKQVVGFRAYGGGFGHGVGMCQVGAVGMAEKGRSYHEILAHYYRGIELVRWY